jgi:hypothetical protein
MEKVKTCNFSMALEAVKKGKGIARTIWKREGMVVRVQFPASESSRTMPYLYIEYPADNKATHGTKRPWIASQPDIMAEDWVILD